MGVYIERDSAGNVLLGMTKAEQLLADGATELTHPTYQPFLVAVVTNHDDRGSFQAAAFVYSRQEFWAKLNGVNGRPCHWLVAEKALRSQFSSALIDGHIADFRMNNRLSPEVRYESSTTNRGNA